MLSKLEFDFSEIWLPLWLSVDALQEMYLQVITTRKCNKITIMQLENVFSVSMIVSSLNYSENVIL